MSLVSQNPGSRDRRVAIILRETARGAAGGLVESAELYDHTFASFSPDSGREIGSALAQRGESSGVLRIRYRTDLHEKMLIRIGEETFEIVAPPVEIGRKQFLDVAIRRSHRTAPAESIDVGMTERAGASLHSLVHSTLPTYF